MSSVAYRYLLCAQATVTRTHAPGTDRETEFFTLPHLACCTASVALMEIELFGKYIYWLVTVELSPLTVLVFVNPAAPGWATLTFAQRQVDHRLDEAVLGHDILYHTRPRIRGPYMLQSIWPISATTVWTPRYRRLRVKSRPTLLARSQTDSR
jgi:hypothetical protein